MRKPLPPFVTLSQDGRVIAYTEDTALYVVNVEDGMGTTYPLLHGVQRVALSPYGSVGIVSGYDKISLFRHQAEATWLATRTIPAPLFRSVISEDCLVVGAYVNDKNQTHLFVWESEKLIPMFFRETESIGQVAPYHIRLNDKTRQVLAWGVEGKSAFSGEGKPFVRLLSITTEGIETQWAGEGMPFERRGFLYPLKNDELGIYNLETLVMMPSTIQSNDVPSAKTQYTFNNLERVAISPKGNYIVWLWNDAVDTSHLRVADLATGNITTETAFNHLGHFPMIAVNDEGQASLSYSENPNRVLAFMVKDNELVKQIDIDTN